LSHILPPGWQKKRLTTVDAVDNALWKPVNLMPSNANPRRWRQLPCLVCLFDIFRPFVSRRSSVETALGAMNQTQNHQINHRYLTTFTILQMRIQVQAFLKLLILSARMVCTLEEKRQLLPLFSDF
jgi:hypothetical protein